MSRPRLDILSGELSGRSYVVDEDEFVIGRGRSCDLVIPKRYISREHARIVRGRDAFVIDGLSEKNPVVVSDRPVRGHVLRDGDVFEMCGIQFRFSIPKAGEGPRNHSTVESQSGFGWKDEDTEAGFGEEARARQQAKAPAGDSWDDDAGWEKEPREPKRASRRGPPAPATGGVEEDSWEDAPRGAPKDDSWEDAPRGAPKDDSWEDAPAAAGPSRQEGWNDDPAPRKTAESWSDDDDEGWDAPAPKSKGKGQGKGKSKSKGRGPAKKAQASQDRVVFEVDEDDDPNEATGALSAKKLSHLSSRGSGERESDAERTAELGKQLDPDDPDYDPFAQLDSEGQKKRETDPSREKTLRVLSIVGALAVVFAFVVFKKITEVQPPKELVSPQVIQTYVNGSIIFEVTWQRQDRPSKPRRIPRADLTGEPADSDFLVSAGNAKVEWLLPALETRSLFLIHGVATGPAEFKLFFPISNRVVTYPIEIAGEDPHAKAEDALREELGGGSKSPRELANLEKAAYAGGESLLAGRDLPNREGFYRQAFLKFREARLAVEALAAAEGRRGGRTQATADELKKCEKAEASALAQWEEKVSRELGRYRNLVLDSSASDRERRDQLKSLLRLLHHTCDVRFRRLETILNEAYETSLTTKDPCPHAR